MQTPFIHASLRNCEFSLELRIFRKTKKTNLSIRPFLNSLSSIPKQVGPFLPEVWNHQKLDKDMRMINPIQFYLVGQFLPLSMHQLFEVHEFDFLVFFLAIPVQMAIYKDDCLHPIDC